MRDAFGAALVELAEDVPDLVVLDGDNATSTRTRLFADRFGDSFFNVGIAEQNLVGVAAGLALAGARPVACAFASMLVNRALDQITHSVAHQDLGVVLVGHYAGLSGGREGACHHSTSDVAVLRAVPNLAVLVPACDADVLPLLRLAVDRGRPAYLRLSRNPSAAVPDHDRGSLAEGWRYWGADDPEVLVVVTGPLLPSALDAVPRAGERVGVLNVVSVKPFPDTAFGEVSRSARAVVAVEEHSTTGGLGSAVAEAASGSGATHLRIGVPDVFTVSGDHGELLQLYGLTTERIASVVRSLTRGELDDGHQH
ncbi:transketolase family protein [Umezawaea endophytica]|uniref:Transketolase-like pyrimidine-binding domain-containing protein n=1 Tax=Umezawaea endophytica TaxID=1654476 RepID=A0A9X2VPE7_9PSEU|nr:transketolase C-terminal domain-containing protein [Umezawaea endophytica]MCS7480348.1 hypothetical protein [Umezawaea endophytica]